MNEARTVLIIGDSISMGYFPHAAAEAGQLTLVRHNGNGGDSANVLANLDIWLEQFPDAEIVHINCGLHDLKRDRPNAEYQVAGGQYRANLREIVSRLQSDGRRIIWATTTPVIDDRHARRGVGYDRYQRDVLAYNAAAAGIMSSAGVDINDLHSVVQAAGTENCIGSDGVHMTDAGYRQLARAVLTACRANR